MSNFKSKTWSISRPLSSDNFATMANNDVVNNNYAISTHGYGFQVQDFTTDIICELDNQTGEAQIGDIFEINVLQDNEVWMFGTIIPFIALGDPTAGIVKKVEVYLSSDVDGRFTTFAPTVGDETKAFSISGIHHHLFPKAGKRIITFKMVGDPIQQTVTIHLRSTNHAQLFCMSMGSFPIGWPLPS